MTAPIIKARPTAGRSALAQRPVTAVSMATAAVIDIDLPLDFPDIALNDEELALDLDFAEGHGSL